MSTAKTTSIQKLKKQAVAQLEEEKVDGDWEWTEEREEALDLTFKGFGPKKIAERVNVHRNTITNWQKHPEFLKRLEAMTAETRRTVRLRRAQQTNAFTERIVKIADKALTKAEENPKSYQAKEEAREWLGMYREFRDEERIDAGENITRIEHQGALDHNHGVRAESFKGFLKGVIEDGVIDVEAIDVEGDDAGAVIEAVTQAALTAGDLLEDITEEDRQRALLEGEPK